MQTARPWLGECRLRRVGTDQEFTCGAAVWANSYHECKVRLGNHVRAMGHSLLDMQGFHTEDEQWQSQIGHEALTLVRQVSAEKLVMLGARASTNSKGAQAARQTDPLVEALSPVSPLRKGTDAWREGDLPDVVRAALFGQTVTVDDKSAEYGDAENGPPLRTFAILDATKFGAGASEIEACNMPFRSMFIGKAAKELADIAPYIVQLDPLNRFTRRLFKHDPSLPEEMTSMHLWHREPGIYVRTRLTMDALWRHFRRFTRVRDERGTWFVLRFYDPNVVLDMAEHLEQSNRRRFFVPDIELIVFRSDGSGYRIRG